MSKRSYRIKERIERLREQNKDTKYVLYVARDDFEYDEYDEAFTLPGKLHIFYDSPELGLDNSDNTYRWTNARMIGEIPSYMFPDIKERTFKVFVPEEMKL